MFPLRHHHQISDGPNFNLVTGTYANYFSNLYSFKIAHKLLQLLLIIGQALDLLVSVS